MSTQTDEIEFDDTEAIRFILNFIPQEDRQGISDDDVQYVLDIIYDFYESEGLIDEDVADNAEIDEEAMLHFVQAAAQRDHVALTTEQIQLILAGEYQYGVSIGIYDKE